MDERDRRHLEAAKASAAVAREHVRVAGASWQNNQMAVDAIAKRIVEVGEQLTRVSIEQQAAMPGIPWREVKGIRVRLTHDYAHLDLDILEGVVEGDLPALISEIDKALAEP